MMDGKGDTLRHKTYACYDFSSFVRGIPDAGYIITGQKLTNIGYQAYLLKLDSVGDKQWENIYGRPGMINGIDVIVTKDGNYMMVGRNSMTMKFNGTDQYGVYLAKVKPNGDSIWTKTLNCKGNTVGSRIMETMNGG